MEQKKKLDLVAKVKQMLADPTAQGGQMGTIIGLVMIAVGILTLAIVLTIGPPVGYNVENSISIPATSGWSTTGNAEILNGSEVWEQDTPLIGSASIVVIAAVIVGTLLGAFIIQRSR